MIVFMGLSLCWPLPPRHYFKTTHHGLADAEGRTLTVPITGIAPRCQEAGCKNGETSMESPICIVHK